MRVYKNPIKYKRQENRLKKIEETNKTLTPNEVYYTDEKGNKIKYISCNIEHSEIIKNKIK